jgi:hypothetical protein
MIQKSKKAQFNLIDVLIIAFILGLIAVVIYWMFGGFQIAEKTKNEAITFEVRISNVKESTLPFITEGLSVRDSVTGETVGTIVAVRSENSRYEGSAYEDGKGGYVLNMTELHMRPNILASSGSKQKSFNKVYDRSLCPEDLILLSKADHQGRGLESNYGETEEILRERLGVFYEIMEKPYVMGRDLIDAGLKPDQNFSKLLERAHLLRLSGVTKEVALGEVLSYSRELEGLKD